MFWKKLPQPFMILAPMADVTDWAFRQIVAECGKPDVFYTEFISCDGLCSQGRDRLMKHLYFTENERPIVAQFFGAKPEHFFQCAKLSKELGFDGVDINMGCPDRKVIKQGAGAALIQNPSLAQEIIAASKEGAGSLPVSVKTRLGFDAIETDKWIPKLLETDLAAITIHGRTKKELSLVPAHWDEIGKVADMAEGTETLIIGNGDVENLEEAESKIKMYGLDGVMVGRGIFKNPWFFNPNHSLRDETPLARIILLRKHVGFFTQLWGEEKNFALLKRFFKIYIQCWEGAKELRIDLMGCHNSVEVEAILRKHGY